MPLHTLTPCQKVMDVWTLNMPDTAWVYPEADMVFWPSVSLLPFHSYMHMLHARTAGTCVLLWQC